MSPVIELPTKNLIVPEEIVQKYISGYDAKTLARIECLYQEIKEAAFSQITQPANPGASLFVLVAGTQGVGKTEMVKRLQEDRQEQFIVCDVDSILSAMPEVKDAIKNAEQQLYSDFSMASNYNSDIHRNALDEAVEYYRNAAKYISDRLMNESVEAGLNVIVETNAKTPNMDKFLTAVKESGVVLEGHICDAPFRIKEKGAASPQHGFSLPAHVLKAEHEAFRGNMQKIADACDKALTVWFRHDTNTGLSPISVATAHTYTTDLVGKAAFEAHFADVDGRTISSLMGNRRNITQAPRPLIADEFRVTV